jgi:hypothetical protein
MNIPGMPNMPAPNPRMQENWSKTGHFNDDSWRWPPIEMPKAQPPSLNVELPKSFLGIEFGASRVCA